MHKTILLICTALMIVQSSPIPNKINLAGNASYSDPICSGNIKNLWLDVVVVVDKSQQMTNAQLWQVRNTITQVFGAVGQIGPVKWPADPRSTSVGVITYDTNATVNAEVDASTSFSDLYNVVQTSLVQVDSTKSSYLSNGLVAAKQAFNESLRRTYRYNFQQVIIVFAADYQGVGTALDASPIADDLKSNYVIIITVSCTSDPTAASAIGKIASPGYSFVDDMNTAKLVGQLTSALIRANCACPEDYVHYRSDFNDPASTQYAVCVQGYSTSYGTKPFDHAVEYCEGVRPNTYLANVFSKNKEDFLIAFMNSTFPRSKKLEFYIGLSYMGGQFKWEQGFRQPHLPLSGYTNWASGYPKPVENDGIAIQSFDNGLTYQWAAPEDDDWLIACQIPASSTEAYTDWGFH